VANQDDMQYGVFPVVPRANEVDQPKWTDEELEALPVEFKPEDDKSKDKNKKDEGDKKADDKGENKDPKSTGDAPLSGGQPALPKA